MTNDFYVYVYVYFRPEAHRLLLVTPR